MSALFEEDLRSPSAGFWSSPSHPLVVIPHSSQTFRSLDKASWVSYSFCLLTPALLPLPSRGRPRRGRRTLDVQAVQDFLSLRVSGTSLKFSTQRLQDSFGDTGFFPTPSNGMPDTPKHCLSPAHCEYSGRASGGGQPDSAQAVDSRVRQDGFSDLKRPRLCTRSRAGYAVWGEVPAKHVGSLILDAPPLQSLEGWGG